MTYQYISYTANEFYAEILLNRPEKRNAFNEGMITELLEALSKAEQTSKLKVLVLKGADKVFSAGADLQWMQQVADYSYDQNLRESKTLSELFRRIYHSPLTVIAYVHGAAMGGALGLVSASDIVVADPDTKFRFSEVKLGLVPATIAPYVLKRISLSAARYYMLSAMPFTGENGYEMGLVNTLKPFAEFETHQQDFLEELRENGHEAMQLTKILLNRIAEQAPEEVQEDTIKVIAAARVSEEGQQRMQHFFKKKQK